MAEKPIAPPDCPTPLRVTEQVPMLHVVDVDRSAAFYALLGFGCESRFRDDAGRSNWCALSSAKARLFLARASGPIAAREQAVLFYMYANDVRALREHLLARGLGDAGPVPGEGGHRDDEVEPVRSAAFAIVPRFYMPQGELRVHDPDGYVILIGQTD
jgi:hypothetical protein